MLIEAMVRRHYSFTACFSIFISGATSSIASVICVAIDLLAHGTTKTSPKQGVDFAAQAEMLEAVYESLKLDQVDLVANDSGGGTL